MKKIILTILLLFSAFYFNDTYAGQGCCSWHGGQSYCDTTTGRRVCNDGTYSPTCTCSSGSDYNYYSPTIVTCPANSYLVGSSCYCNSGYYVSGGVCVKEKTCSDLYGYGSYETLDGKCACSSGYTWSTDSYGNEKCESVYTYCSSNYGYGSEWSYSKEQCVCKSGYVVNDEGDGCRVETEKDKAISYYLVKLYNNDDNALVMGSDKKVYEIELGTGCSSIWKYEEKLVYIYKGGLYLDGISDKLFLDDGSECSIWDGKEVDLNDYSSYDNSNLSCGKNSSEASDGKSCLCNTGYTWEDKNDANNLDCVPKTIYNTCTSTKNIYLGSDYNCYCISGYVWSSDKNECIKSNESVSKTETNNDSLTEKKAKEIFETIQTKYSIYNSNEKVTKYKNLVDLLKKFKSKYNNKEISEIIDKLITYINDYINSINSDCDEVSQLLGLCSK